MRPELFYNPLALLQRLGEWAVTKRRLRRLNGTVGANLQEGHIDSLELLELLRPISPKVIYDIGGNVGTWTLLAKVVFPGAEIHAFEPLAFHAAKFKEGTKRLTNVHLHPVALGSEQGVADMKVVDFTDASSLLPLTPAGRTRWSLKDTGIETVKVERLDDWIRTARIPEPQLLKLDVQGFELEVLKGASECLRKVPAVIAEVSFQEFYSRQCLFHELAEFLSRSDHLLCAFGKGIPVGSRLVQADALFVKRSALGLLS